MQEDNNKILLPHHEQQSLCTTRLPYRQGRKLTAVKVYTITKESNHLLIFGVPSLNLRQETKALFINFGKLLQFNISKEHASEAFTETYHAQYERIQSARLAKRMLDIKNFYGGSLHVCYAPELETVDETRQKLIQRQRDVIFRLNNLNKDDNIKIATPTSIEIPVKDTVKLNMGDINTITIGRQVKEVRKKRKLTGSKKFEPCFVEHKKPCITHSNNITNITDGNIVSNVDSNSITPSAITECTNITLSNSSIKYSKDCSGNSSDITSSNVTVGNHSNVEVIDCTGVDEEVITNINEGLNYNNFGNEIIKKVPQKPVSKIQFHINKKS